MNSVSEYEVRTRLLYSSRIGTVLLLLIDATVWLQRPDIVDFHNRIQSVPGPFIQDIYDFVVIGAGSAGAVMAARLSEMCHWDVLLLEAGQDETYLTDIPFLYPTLQTTRVDWKFRTEPSEEFCLAMKNGQCRWPRGKVLGGSSTINAMLYVRGNRRDFDAWRDLGNDGWSYADLLPYFIKLENMRDGAFRDRPYHGKTGPISVERYRYQTPLRAYLWAGLEELGLINPYGEVNGPSQTGFAEPHGSLRDGLRCSTAKGYLRPAGSRKNLHISMNTLVEKILIDPRDKRAYGVQFEQGNQRYYVMVSKEVILSAGALNSPHLLMLSGVGPREQLEHHAIPVLQELPGVGRNMQDHVATGAAAYTVQNPDGDFPLAFDFRQSIDPETLRQFLLNGEGPLYGMPLCSIMGFWNSKYQNPRDDWPDIEFFLAALSDMTDGGRFGKRSTDMTDKYYADLYEHQLYANSYTVIPMLSRPHSTGWLELASRNPRDHIRIYPNYFSDRRDLMTLIEGLKFAETLANTTAMRRINATLVDYSRSPCRRSRFTAEDDFYICLVRHYTQTIYHPCSTAKMGPDSDPMAVVDRHLRVRGIGGLRVVDASVFPLITTGNTNVPTIAVAEKAADIVKAAYLEDLRHHANDLRQCSTVQFDYSARPSTVQKQNT
ncbi:glucose dehydrogenase [FAD, quinone]-like [Anopheles albimanus]|uniref:Glucose-methanol-choline oxidoreductase N-terminal domain-containing protein n=1 Tax=Anopheles albimanus TaxID=7167 RepID=A0A182F7P6_ANOAL|nr:glucose dehydrogenase [FAD, quinone]-like [Anopheles albimanus]